VAWLTLLGLLAILSVLLLRMPRRKTSQDEPYVKRVAVEHLTSGVAWVGSDEKIRAVNPAMADSLEVGTGDLAGHDWCDLFVPSDREGVRQAYTQMLLTGRASVKARGVRLSGTHIWFDVLLLAVHDGKMRFIGHHCLTSDRSREQELEERIEQLNQPMSVH
jgi:PAS domain S-box-containing protein